MTSVEHRPAFPALAKSFEAALVGQTIVVRAREPFLHYPTRGELVEPLHDLMGGYAEKLAQLGSKLGWGKRFPPVAFANNASTDEALLDFVRTFGWFEVPKSRLRYEVRAVDDKPSVCESCRRSAGREKHLKACAHCGGKLRRALVGFWLARQSLPDLRREQRVFAAAARLLAEVQVRRPRRPDPAAIADAVVVLAMDWTAPDQEIRLPLVRLLGSVPLNPPRDELLRWTREAALSRPEKAEEFGHDMLETVLNRFPSRLVVLKGRKRRLVAEMPEARTTGLKGFLYGVLRRAYLSGCGDGGTPTLGACRRPECREFFAVERHGRVRPQVYCGERCSRLDRQRDYHRRRGKFKRRERRARARGKASKGC